MKQSLKHILDNLSYNLKKAFYSDHTLNTIKDAVNLGQLKADSDRLNMIQEDVMNVLLGRSPLNTFKKTLKLHLNIPDTNLIIVNKIIQDRIFKPLKNDLDQLEINLSRLISQEIEKKEIIPSQKTFKTLKEKTIKIAEKKEFVQEQKSLEEAKIKVITKKESLKKKVLEQPLSKQTPSEQIIPEYSFPEPSKIKVEKPVSRTAELKKIIAPKVSSNQQEEIRKKLLAAMQKKNGQPKIIDEMKKVFLKPLTLKEIKEGTPKQTKIEKLTSSKILSGEGKKFKDEESFVKTDAKKPYIFDTKLKEEPARSEVTKDDREKEKISEEKPIAYKKYQKKNPFGKA